MAEFRLNGLKQLDGPVLMPGKMLIFKIKDPDLLLVVAKTHLGQDALNRAKAHTVAHDRMAGAKPALEGAATA